MSVPPASNSIAIELAAIAIALNARNCPTLDLISLQRESAGSIWDFMFPRAMFQADDMAQQGALLNRIDQLIDSGVLQTICKDILEPSTAANLR